MNKFVARYSYLLLSALLLVMETLHILKGEWTGDFWEHSAVVNELTFNFFHPAHPMLNVDTPHAFFSPYALCVALFSKITGLDSIKALQWFAFLNLLFFITSFYFFCNRLFKEKASPVANLGLIFVLFFWGSSPLLWSGFYHIFVLNYILPYPSTFAMCLSFITLGILAKDKPGLNIKSTGLCLLIAITFLTHPYTGIFLGISVTAMIFIFYRETLKQSLFSFLVIAISSFIFCCLWPYYNFVALLTDNKEFHEISQALYTRIPGIYWPILLILPFILFLKKSEARDFLFLSVLLMLIFYAAGYLFKLYGFGRIITDAILFSQLFLAFAIISVFSEERKTNAVIYSSLVLILFVISLVRNSTGLKDVVNISERRDLTYYTKYAFLKSLVSHNEVILSDQLSNWYIPTYGGKVISSAHPLFLVKDGAERKKYVDIFFDSNTIDQTRQEILQKYSPGYILIDSKTNSFSPKSNTWLDSIGNLIYEKDGLKLIKLKIN